MSEALLVHADRDGLAAALAAQLGDAIEAAVGRSGAATLVVAGGSTPAPAYRALDASSLAFARVTMLPSDERWVPVDHELSNDAMLRSCFPSALAAGLTVVPLSSAPTPIEDALRDVDTAVGALPSPFDVVLLGMGDDGHTASLFPDDPAIAENEASEALAAIARPPSQPTARVTLTPRALLKARELVLAISGAEKRRVIEEALQQPDLHPIGRLLARSEVPTTIHWCP
ncbi:MAG: 6-phosphogluconolactonase [Pseudomonadota bacterium]